MRHHKAQRKLGRVRKERSALLRSLARSLILYKKIETTEAKAKELRPYVERLVTMAGKNTLSARREISARLGNQPDITQRLMETIAPQFKDRPGGYTRITKIGTRNSDSAKKAVIEFVE